ncbi:MAG: hypothetical protein FWG75_06630 [Cystobacterineae bacterium]|nr:hypothetical protein [Cystobacterineae bacterium]
MLQAWRREAEAPGGSTHNFHAPMRFLKRLAARQPGLRRLCFLLLGAALGACSSSEEEAQKDNMLEVRPRAIGFSPLGENTTTFKVMASGFANRAEADAVQLELVLEGAPSWLLLGPALSEVADNSKTFSVSLQYVGQGFMEAPAMLHLWLSHMPEGYGPAATQTQSIRIVVGNGQKEHPIPLNQDNIKAFNSYANTQEGLSQHYKLIENIVLPPPQGEPSNWTPIGVYAYPISTPFVGSFDGDGFSISGLVMEVAEEEQQGFFGQSSGEIKNLGLIELHVAGGEYIGGLVGNNLGTVQNCYATGNVSGYAEVGGLVGSNSGRIEKSHATANVSASLGFVGGLLGDNHGGGRVEKSYATGNVSGRYNVGGLVGNNGNASSVENCYATGNVEGRESAAAGLVALNDGGWVQNSYATGSVHGSSDVGGVVGHSEILYSPESRVQGCVALNPSLRQASDESAYIGRVLGSNCDIYEPDEACSTLSNNHARHNMVLSYNNGSNSYSPHNSLSSKDGLASADYNRETFWRGLGWDFSTVWQWGSKGLPILRELSGEQNHTVLP